MRPPRHAILGAALLAVPVTHAPGPPVPGPAVVARQVSPVPAATRTEPLGAYVDEDGLGGDLAEVRGYFAGARRASFGGVYIARRDGTLVVLVTAGAARHREALRRRVPRPDLLRVRTVRWSLAALTRAAAKVVRAGGFSGVGPDERANDLWVGLAHDTPAARARVLRALAPEERAMVRFEESRFALTRGR
jgi:hypothetical protein